MKKVLSLALALALCLGLTVPAFAAKAGDTTVSSDSGVFSFSKPILGTEYVKFTHNTYSEWAAAHEADPSLPYLGSGEIIKDAFVDYGIVSESADGFTAVLVSEGTIMTVPSSYHSGFLRDGNGDGISTGGVGEFQKVDFSVGLVSNDEWTRFTEDAQGKLTFAYSAFYPGDIYYISSGNELSGQGKGIFVKLVGDKPTEPSKPLAKAGNQDIEIDGTKVAFQTYMLADANGNGTNYVKLRDIAHVLNGTGAQFSVGYNKQEQSISAATGKAYKYTGTEMDTPFAGADKEYVQSKLTIVIDGTPVQLDAITLMDDSGNGYNYFQLRELGSALGFQVGYSRARGVYVETK